MTLGVGGVQEGDQPVDFGRCPLPESAEAPGPLRIASRDKNSPAESAGRSVLVSMVVAHWFGFLGPLSRVSRGSRGLETCQ
jgi:hypothetical protein